MTKGSFGNNVLLNSYAEATRTQHSSSVIIYYFTHLGRHHYTIESHTNQTNKLRQENY